MSSASSSEDFSALLEAELAAAESQDESEDDDDEKEECGSSGRKRLLEDENDELHPAKRQAGICPPHPGSVRGLCIRCGENVSPEPGELNVALRYIHQDFVLAEDEIERIRQSELQDVLSRKKLFLVLDLDHTMLNSARVVEVPANEAAYLDRTYFETELAPVDTTIPMDGCPAIAAPIQAGWGGLYKVYGLHMWTKLRPYAHKFLEEVSKLYELYVYTMGEKVYALTMAHLLDPTGKLFKGRVISQSDSTRRHSKDLDVVLGAESAVVILDDTEGVWPNHKLNLIVMERYHFFTSSSKHFGMDVMSLTEGEMDESEAQGALANVLQVLRMIHDDFFKHAREAGSNDFSSRDIREVVENRRSQILSGCKILFSRVIPTDYPRPERHGWWLLALSLGAECGLELDDSITHVVSFDRTTEKSMWAKQRGKFLVHPSWLEGAYSTWSRPSESDYPVRNGQTRRPVYSFTRTEEVSAAKLRYSGKQPGEAVAGTGDRSELELKTEAQKEEVSI